MTTTSAVVKYGCFNTMLEMSCISRHVLVFESARYGRNDSTVCTTSSVFICHLYLLLSCSWSYHIFSLRQLTTLTIRNSLSLSLPLQYLSLLHIFPTIDSLPISSGDGQTSCKVWLASTERRCCSNEAKTRNPLKFSGCPKLANRSQPLVSRNSPYCEDILLFNKLFFRLPIHALVAKILAFVSVDFYWSFIIDV